MVRTLSAIILALVVACGGSEWWGSGSYSLEVREPNTPDGGLSPVMECGGSPMTGNVTIWADGKTLGGTFDLCKGYVSGEVTGHLIDEHFPAVELRMMFNGRDSVMVLRDCDVEARGWDCRLFGGGFADNPAILRRVQ